MFLIETHRATGHFAQIDPPALGGLVESHVTHSARLPSSCRVAALRSPFCSAGCFYRADFGLRPPFRRAARLGGRYRRHCWRRHRAALLWPFGGAVADAWAWIFFLIEGAVSIMYALDHRREFSGRWGWMLASGAVDIVLAILILAGFPGTAAWAIGLLVGINMLMGGIALVAMALHARAA
jgi:hypothetical protein